jgi:acyl-CoA synthetase (AMP-forming)/AMP-acid ligase II
LLLHTSGTTSRPKLVPLLHRNLCASAFNIGRTLRLSPDDCCLNVMPLFHIHGLVAGLLSSLAAGGRVVCAPDFSAPRFFEWMAEFRPSWYTAVPTMHQTILEQGRENADVIARHRLRFIRSSSAALPAPVMAELEAVFRVPVIESYGMTEAAHQMASNPLPPAQRKPRSVGRAAGPEIAIMDEHGGLLAAGERGEVVIRGANVMPGYNGNREANLSAFTNGWFRTGDQGYLDADGYLFLTGRLKEIINRGGEKISPREVDEALLEHPAIAQAVAFALPHPTLGEDIAAAVVLKEKNSASAHAIREFLFERLTDFKIPSQVVIVPAIPKGPTGKLQRIGLADKLAENLKKTDAAPRNEFERIVAEIFAEVLKINDFGVEDNFFALGGDSLRGTQVATRIQAIFDIDLSNAVIFRKPTVAELAEEIAGSIEDADMLSALESLSAEDIQKLLAD